VSLAWLLLAAHVQVAALPQVGYATWYSAPQGVKTASGEVFDARGLTAAHRTLPFGTCVSVTRVDTSRTVRVRITDRGPFAGKERIIDLSPAAAERLGMSRMGVAKVRLGRCLRRRRQTR